MQGSEYSLWLRATAGKLSPGDAPTPTRLQTNAKPPRIDALGPLRAVFGTRFVGAFLWFERNWI